MSIGPTGIWHPSHLPHKTSTQLVSAVLELLPPPRTVRDLGCGPGHYLAELALRGCEVSGIEGTPGVCPADYVYCADLTEPLNLPPVDLTLCIEVGEHIPLAGSSVFLDNVRRSVGRDLVMSWAVPDQPGHGHVNCQSNITIIKWLECRGLWYDAPRTQAMRQLLAKDECWWLPETVMVFSA